MSLRVDSEDNSLQINLIRNFTLYLHSKGCSAVTIKNYVSDVKKFIRWKDDDIFGLSQKDFYDYRNYLKSEEKTKAIAKRYLSSVARFYEFFDIKLPSSYTPPENTLNTASNKKKNAIKKAKKALIAVVAITAVLSSLLMAYPEKLLELDSLYDSIFSKIALNLDDGSKNSNTSDLSYDDKGIVSVYDNNGKNMAAESKVLAENVVITNQGSNYLSNNFLSYRLFGKRGEIVENYIDKYLFHGVAKLLEKAEVDFYEDINVLKKATINKIEIEEAKIKDLDLEGDANFDDLTVDDLEVTDSFRVGRFDSDPSGNANGSLYFNTSNNQLYVNDGDSWNQVGTTYTVITGGGLQLVNNQFGLLTCSANEILKYIGGTWTCSSDASGGGGDFLSLTDTPNSYSGQGGRLVRVGVGESSLEFLNASGWDQDSSDDLTTSTSFSGDVSGTYNNLQLGTSVVGSTELASSGVTAGTYGAATSIPVFTVDADGRITAASNTAFDTSTITSVGTITSGSWQGAVIQVPYGGTGASSFTTNGLLYGNGTGALQTVSVGTSGQILTVNASSQPIWATAASLTSGLYWSLTGNAAASTSLLGTTNTEPLRIASSGLERIRVFADGTIGIGTSSPLASTRLQVENLSTTGTASGAMLNIGSTSSSAYVLDARVNSVTKLVVRGDGSVGIGDTNNAPILNVGVGTTSSPFSISILGEPTLSNTGRHLRYVNLSSEYPGAVLTNLYGTSTEPNTNGSMTSDLTSTGVGTSVAMPYYEWTSTQSTTQAYIVAVRVVLPQDFDGWNNDGSDDLTINYQTTDGTVGNNNFSVRIIGPTGSTGQYTGSLLASASWTTTTVDSASFGASGNTGWDGAGESAVIYLRLEAQNSNVARVGDIILKYKSKW